MNREMISDNLTARHIARGINVPNSVDRIYDINGSLGGPIQRDRIWFFFASRRSVADRRIANSFYKDGRPGLDDNRQFSNLGRITWQVTERNKYSVHFDKVVKERFHDHSLGDVVEEASQWWRSPLYATWVSKWTSTISSRLLFEVGFSGTTESWMPGYQRGIGQERPANLRPCYVTPCFDLDPNQIGNVHPWYARATRQDLSLRSTWASRSSSV